MIRDGMEDLVIRVGEGRGSGVRGWSGSAGGMGLTSTVISDTGAERRVAVSWIRREGRQGIWITLIVGCFMLDMSGVDGRRVGELIVV